MSGQSSISEEFLPLLDAACDGTLGETQFHEFTTLLDSDPVVRKAFIDHVRLRTNIQFLARAERARDLVFARIRATPQALPPGSAPPAVSFLGNAFDGNAFHGGAVAYFSSGWPVAYLVATVILAIGLLAGSLTPVSAPVYVGRQSAPRPSPLAPSLSSSMVFVGRITGLVDCEWSDPTTAVPGPAAVPLGRKYALASGLMEITYDTGAKVILQGPCTYEVESAGGGYLSVGKLTARVEKGEAVRSTEYGVRSGGKSDTAENQKSEIRNQKSSLSTLDSRLFTIKTPTATVTDLGTEFGVEVSKEGRTMSHVFRGKVEVRLAARDGQRGQAVRLTENESALVEKDENGDSLTVRRAEADPASFVRAGQVPKYAEEVRLKPFRRWQAYSQELRRDPSLLAYYDFQQKPGQPAVLPNVAAPGGTIASDVANNPKSTANTAIPAESAGVLAAEKLVGSTGLNRLDGIVENAVWTTGRMPGKHALLFQSPTDYVRVEVPQEANDLTLAAWVCFDSLQGGISSALLMSEGWHTTGQVHWQVDNSEGRLVFSTTSVSEASAADNFSAKSWVLVGGHQLHQWKHFVSVFDHQTKRVQFYVNGRRLNGVDYATSAPLSISHARIGGWDGGDRNFHGKIDELAVFGRPLADDEIRRMYDEGKP
jgi:hypothetical protein